MTWMTAGIMGGSALIGSQLHEDPLTGALMGAGVGAGGASLMGGQGGLLSSIGSGGAGAVPTATNTMAQTAVSEGITPSALGAVDKAGMDQMLLRSGNMTAPGPGYLEKAQTALGFGPDPHGASAAAKRDAVAGALPEDTPGFTSKLTTGLMNNASAFVPDKNTAPPSPGPALRQGQQSMPGSLFMEFNRKRR